MTQRDIGYLRVSTDDQTTENQRLKILEEANRDGVQIDDWVEVTVSSRAGTVARRIDELLGQLEAGDTIWVAELSRLGRSVGQVVTLVHELVERGVFLRCLKEGIRITGDQDMQTKVMVTMFSLFAEIERDLISERTKEGLARARSEGKLLGRPQGPGKSKLDEHKDEILAALASGVSKKRVAEDFGTTPGNLAHWLKRRGL